jgi:hypothetical protein
MEDQKDIEYGDEPVVDQCEAEPTRPIATMDYTVINFILTGLAYVQPIAPTASEPNGKLEILFLHPDEQHELKVSMVKNDGEGPERILSSDNLKQLNKMKVTRSAGVTALPGSFPEHLVNLVSLHDSPDLAFRPKNPALRLSYLSLPSNMYGTTAYTSLPHTFWKHYTTTPRKEFIPDNRVPGLPVDGYRFGRKIAKTITVGFKLQAGQEMSLSFEEPISKEFTFRYEAGVTYKITFDNECENHPCVSDFGYYYEILQDRGLEIEEVPNRPPVIGEEEEELNAACNPAAGIPPLGCTLEEYFAGTCP